ncbi:MAG: glycosyltransferase [Candidatus Woesearchaeota archaeon]|nr:glycosyltransferase [Candidatus Woesearchaeota archaeon]
MTTMRVCMLTTSFPQSRNDTQAHFIYELCAALAKKKILVDVICPADRHAQKEEVWEDIQVHRFQYMISRRWQKLTAQGGILTNLKSSWIARIQWPIFSVVFLWKSWRYAKKADIIHCQWSFSG